MSTDLEPIQIDQAKILKYLNLDPQNPATQAAVLVAQRYNLDPVLKHIVLISGNVYVTRDGYLAIAHASGQFDGIEVMETGENETHYTAKVAVYRKDMSRPIAYVGRYPKAQRMAKDYGPEMAVKVAEVQALRRAFNVTGVAAADERWDEEAERTDVRVVDSAPAELPPAQLADIELLDSINGDVANMDDEFKAVLRGAWKNAGLPKPFELNANQAATAVELIETVKNQASETYDKRRRQAMAELSKIDLTGKDMTDARHAFVAEVAGIEGGSTRALTQEQLDAIVAAVNDESSRPFVPADETLPLGGDAA